MKISAILCHHKNDLVLKAIRSLQNQKDVEVEIIVATSVENIHFEGAKTIYVQGGPAYKRNIAFRFASHDLIAFFDDDIEAIPTACYEMVKALEQNGIGMVFGKLLNMEFTSRLDEAGSFLTWSGFLYARSESGILDHGQFEDTQPVLAGKSAACMIRRSVFVEAGLFDSSYEILGEESDLSWRVWLCGYKVLYVPSSVTYHAFNTKFKPPEMYTPKRVYYNGARNYLTMLYTNLGKKRWIIPILTQITVWTTAALGMLLTGKREAGLYILKGLGYFFSNIKTIWKKRAHVQWNLRKIRDSDLLPVIQKSPPLSYYLKRFLGYIQTGRHG